MLVIEPFFDQATNTITYVVSDEATKLCAVIDSVLDYDPASKQTSTQSADRVINYIKQSNLTVKWLLETHVHADHLTAAYYLKEQVGGKIGISTGVLSVLEHWAPQLKNSEDVPLNGSQFDCLFKDGDIFKIGEQTVKVLHTPGHTSACASYLVGDAVFVGDVIFMPHMGTGRIDFPGGSAEQSYQSIQKILSLPEKTRIFTGHDYPKEGTSPAWESTIRTQKISNVLINDSIAKEQYIQLRNERDIDRELPRLFYPSIQANLCFGKL
ncbi:MAG: MBL fold metallo-hydrolase [Gammaproteobacteria bacterium]|nr:MBL fold metallo-hydrolase [Gammaproteobacteria bacterium]